MAGKEYRCYALPERDGRVGIRSPNAIQVAAFATFSPSECGFGMDE